MHDFTTAVETLRVAGYISDLVSGDWSVSVCPPWGECVSPELSVSHLGWVCVPPGGECVSPELSVCHPSEQAVTALGCQREQLPTVGSSHCSDKWSAVSSFFLFCRELCSSLFTWFVGSVSWGRIWWGDPVLMAETNHSPGLSMYINVLLNFPVS